MSAMEPTGERYVPSLHGQIYYEHIHRYAIAARFCAGKRVLDVASGEGYGSAFLARDAASVVGVDIDERATEHARRNYYARNLRFLSGPATALPIGDGSVDVVTSFETIEHLTDHESMMREITRVLTPCGVLIISSPNKLVYSDVPKFSNPFHLKELYFAEFRDLLDRNFAHVALYGQRLAGSSLVHPLAGATSERPMWLSGGPDCIGEGLPSFPSPMYFIAVCSDADFEVDISSTFVDPADDLLEDIWSELNAFRSRPTIDPDTLALASEGAQLAVVAQERDNRTAELEVANARVADCQTARAALEGTLSERTSELRHLTSEHGLLSAKHIELTFEHSQVSAELASLSGELDLRASKIGQQASELESIQATMALLQEESANFKARVSESRQAFEDLERTNRAEREQIAILNGDLTDIRSRFDESKSAPVEAQRKAETQEERILRLEGESLLLAQVLNSTTWKVTKPARVLLKRMRDIAGRPGKSALDP